jgi:CheY-like chemotaxis protein
MLKILFIEGYKNQRLLISNELQEEGYTVLSASEGRAGLRLMSESNPDLIITEATLPDMDGSESVHRAHDNRSRIPVIVYSTLIYEPERFLKSGIKAFVSKSCDLSAFIRTVKYVMDGNSELLCQAGG